MAVCCLEEGQVSACNRSVCSLDTLDLRLELWSGEQFPMTAEALSWLSHAPDCAAIHEQGGVFPQDNARPHTAVVTQDLLQSVDMLPWPARSPDLPPIEHAWDIIGRQLQSHPQPALTVPVFTEQMQQA
ncbi:hypothetical protein AVEN_133924-1 [Araneus ventricosus]|uniref:Tc1-like transposase DDE domain-containing protein n=1 Tax=Araneus ventricosus TaxID=182803 RepID=A0A4Y2D3B7_ARAVE|nr:hypothetical protein AVEN_133924-1 [Araneus ventricosus]